MGCLCPRLFNKNKNEEIHEKLNVDEEAPVPPISVPKIEDLEANHMTIGFSKYNDLPQKKKFAEFLVKNDHRVFRENLDLMMNLEDEAFYELFEGNTKYNYNISKDSFKQLVQKFDDNKELTIEYYDKEEYYNIVLQLWRANILQKLKEENDKNKQNELLRESGVDTSKWDDKFREYFESIMNTKPIKSMAERMKNYIKADYGDFDELIKCVNTCKDNVEKEPKNHCNNVLGCNLDKSQNEIINEMIPGFIKKFSQTFEDIKSEFRNQEEQKAIKEILNKGFSEKKEKELINEVKKMYKKKEEETKEGEKKEQKEEEKKNNSGFFSAFQYNSEWEKLRNLGKKFNDENNNYFSDDYDEEKDLIFNELNFKEKAKVTFSNKMVKQAILGISLSNVSYSVLHLSKTFMDAKKYDFEFQERLEEIKRKFAQHQSEVKLIDESDIDKSIEQIIECGKKFNSDLEEVEKLISDIKNVKRDFENERDQTKMNMIKSCVTAATSLAGAFFTEGADRTEYISSSVGNVFAGIGDAINLAKGKEALENFKKQLDEAQALKKQITDEIDKLRNKFSEMSVKHFS